MKRLGMLGIIGGAALLTAAPLSLQWSQKNVALSLDSAEAQSGPRAIGPPSSLSSPTSCGYIPYGNKLRRTLRLLQQQLRPSLRASTSSSYGCTLRHLRQQLRHSLRASEIRLRRTLRTDFLLRVPATLVIGVTDGVADERVIVPARGNPSSEHAPW